MGVYRQLAWTETPAGGEKNNLMLRQKSYCFEARIGEGPSSSLRTRALGNEEGLSLGPRR